MGLPYDQQMEKLYDIIESCATDDQPIIRLSPSPTRENQNDFMHTVREKYTASELVALEKRDFQTRLFISSISFGNCAWMRTHHSDNAERMTNFTYIRDYFKAARGTANHSAAKATMTSLLTAMFAKEKSSYESFATVVASALSGCAENTSFEIGEDIHMVPTKSDHDLATARRHLVVLMNVVFPKISTRRYLLDQKNCNIFRLVHCDIMGRNNTNKWPFTYCIFSFLLQLCLTVFVIFQITVTHFEQSQSSDSDREILMDEEGKSDLLRYGLWVLAFFGSIYSTLLAIPEVLTAVESLEFYGFIGTIPVIDMIVNIAIPVVLVVAGFIVIIQEKESFISAVLNTAALLFIPEIDDRLPSLLGYDEKAIVENYLIKQAKMEYNKYTTMSEQKIARKVKKYRHRLGVQFNDYFVTNHVERGMSDQDFAVYQPYIVRLDDVANEIDPSNYITEDCLLTKLEWKYTNWGKNDTTKPRIGYLKLHKLNGQIVEVKYEGKEYIPLQDKLYSVSDGIYVITSFVFSSSILKLRFCGSKSVEDFENAIDYYSLWEMTFKAKSMLKKHKYYKSRQAMRRGTKRDRGAGIAVVQKNRPDVYTINNNNTRDVDVFVDDHHAP